VEIKARFIDIPALLGFPAQSAQRVFAPAAFHGPAARLPDGACRLATSVSVVTCGKLRRFSVTRIVRIPPEDRSSRSGWRVRSLPRVTVFHLFAGHVQRIAFHLNFGLANPALYFSSVN
jgi:hypothetical protein